MKNCDEEDSGQEFRLNKKSLATSLIAWLSLQLGNQKITRTVNSLLDWGLALQFSQSQPILPLIPNVHLHVCAEWGKPMALKSFKDQGMCLVGLHCRCWWLVDHGVSFSQKGLNDVKNNALRPRTGIRPEDVSRSRSSPLLPWINPEQAWHVLHLHQHLELCWMWLWDFFHNGGFNIKLRMNISDVHSKDSRLKLFFVFAICLYCTVQCVCQDSMLENRFEESTSLAWWWIGHPTFRRP